MKIVVTGHRPHKLGGEYSGIGPISNKLRDLFTRILRKEGCTLGITGMALGIDQLFAEVCIELRINVLACIPCHDQEKMWPLRSKQRYHIILSHPLVKKVYVTDGPYTNDCMQIRNEYMVNQLELPNDKLVGIWDGTSGGTFNCIEYARIMLPKENILLFAPPTK